MEDWTLEKIADFYNSHIFGSNLSVKGNRIIGNLLDEKVNWSRKQAEYNVEGFIKDIEHDEDYERSWGPREEEEEEWNIKKI